MWRRGFQPPHQSNSATLRRDAWVVPGIESPADSLRQVRKRRGALVNLGTSIDIVREIRYSVTERISETLTFFQKGISVDAKRAHPNLADIARHAGVSPATVSRVLHKKDRKSVV